MVVESPRLRLLPAASITPRCASTRRFPSWTVQSTIQATGEGAHKPSGDRGPPRAADASRSPHLRIMARTVRFRASAAASSHAARAR